MRSRGVTLVCSLFLFATSLSPQTSDQCRHRGLAVGVTTVANGAAESQFVEGLQAQDFDVRSRGKTLTVSSAAPTLEPQILVMVSANQVPGWDEARQISANIFAAAQPDQQVGLVLFRDSILEKHELTTRKAAVERLLQIDDKNPILLNPNYRRSELVKSVRDVIDLLGASNPGDSIFVVTGGRDAGAYSEADKLEKTLRTRGIRLVAAIMYDDYFADDEYKTDVQRLTSLAEATGGNAILLKGGSGLARPAYNEQMRRKFLAMVLSYQLELDLPESVTGEVPIDISIRNRNRKETVVLHARKLPACNQVPTNP